MNLVYDYPGIPREESNIEFRGVVLYHFLHPAGAIITEIEETTPDDVMTELGETVTEWARLYGVNGWKVDRDQYCRWLTESGKKAWRIESAIGFYGIVIAESVAQISEK
jgi:hypothetical protein